MDRRHLEYFVAVAEHESFTAAAHALRIAQPSLSQAVKALENEVKTELFHRTARGTFLTSAGEAMLGPARQTLRGFETTAAAAVNVRDLTTGWLDVAAVASVATDPLSDVLAHYHARHPGVVLHIADSGSADIADLVRTGAHELALTWNPRSDEGLATYSLAPEPIYLVVGADRGFAHGASVTPEQLATVGLVVNTASRVYLADLMRVQGIVPRITAETTAREVIVPLVLGGIGAALLPPRAAADARNRGAVVCRLEVPLTRQVTAIWRPGELTPAAEALIGILRTPGLTAPPDPFR
ncbi:DNA-binding transcriptional LysR family regulator [Prauserella sediminis]|uniref:DNA-binding transcriptional LysR family regulator n=1 Tax=Prauserella sediminis TaxID=577680 RepID=A0A839XPS4_9PSEU|nr:LysR family transcriptional regulator [Prauserella sediminis]MBB3664697.1 DNA-binding transcriptional LysR family regulator [Prauserella sediminis]